MTDERHAEWFTEFFDDVYLRVFDPELGPQRTAEEVDAVLALAQPAPGARVLDVACGQGRHAIELARRGYAVTGLDLSGELLDAARDRAAQAGVDVTWLRQDMREPAPGPPHDLVLNLFNAFGYLPSDADDAQALAAMAGALAPGGTLVMEVGNREAQIRDDRPAEVHRIDDHLELVERREIDLRTSRLHVEYLYVEDERVARRRHHVVRLYTLTELVALHAAVGLTVEAVHGGLDGSDLGVDDFFVVLQSRMPG